MTRIDGDPVPSEALKLAAGQCDIEDDRLIRPVQVHSACVRRVGTSGRQVDCDGTVTDRAGLIHSLLTADCIPLFLFHPGTGTTALIHAGWRGLDTGIVEQGLKALELPPDQADELLAVLGPAVRSCCYEVREDVAGRFPGQIRREGERMFLSLQEAMIERLLKAGLRAETIEDESPCSCCHPDDHYSYRYNRTDRRMVSLMGVLF